MLQIETRKTVDPIETPLSPPKTDDDSVNGQPAADWSRFVRPALATLVPFGALALQEAFWPAIRPYVWFLFYPAVFVSSWIGGLWPGLAATGISAAIVLWFFIPPEHSFIKESPQSLLSVAVFVGMGVLFSVFHDRLRKTTTRAAEALAAVRSANGEITRLLERTRELDDLKTKFFANVSHELRTPLALILGPIAKRLSAPDLTAEARRDLEVVDRNARLLHRHVTDLLDVAKLEAGHMTMRWADVDLARLVRFVASHFEVLTDEKRIRFAVTAPDSLSAQVDAEKCQRILLNLLSNAFKFTPEGGAVALTLKAEGGRALLTVKDDGPGVPAELREAIFDRFRQVDGGADRRFGGTGLGLAIVKEFVGLHGGRVNAVEASGGGALFTVALPLTAPAGTVLEPAAEELDEAMARQTPDELRAPAQTAPPRASPAPPDAPLVLVVEDHPDMNAFVAESLGVSFRVATAFDGQEGLSKALAIRPDLIVSDVMMPRMSGDQMVEALRRHRELDDVPIVMLTAKADDALRVGLLRNGVQDFLQKPFSVEELRARVGALLGERRRAARALSESQERLVRALENIPDVVVIYDHELRIRYINAATRRLTGRPPADFIGRRDDEVWPPEVCGVWLPTLKDALQTGALRRLEADLSLPGGAFRSLRITCVPLLSESGEVREVLGITHDFTERREAEKAVRESADQIRRLNADLERRVEERTAELRGANSELESFAYAVSHDLRAPLRAISGFSEALREDYGGRLDGEALVFLDQIHLGTRRLGDLIDGLLQLSRVTRGELRRDAVDLSALAGRILEELARAEPSRSVSWQIEPGLTAEGDARMLAVVLTNLLGNAWKYTSGIAAPTIRFYSGQEPGVQAFCVADDGAGFNMAHAEKLFQPFQRLHRQDEFPGLGIGLATVQRIVRRHGGDISATGAVGRGTTFRFSLGPTKRNLQEVS